MKRFIVGAVVVVAAAGCEPIDLEDLQLSCTADDECPAGLVCDDDGRCNPPPDGSVVVTPVAVSSSSVSTSLVGRPFVDAETPLDVAFVLNKPVASPPRVQLVAGVDDIADVAAVADDAVANGWRARIAASGDEPEVTARVVIAVLDEEVDAERPVSLTTTTAVTFDYTAPEPVAVTLQRLPDAQRTAVAREILGETDVGPAIDVRIVLSSNEPIFVDGDVVDEDAGVVALGDERAPAIGTVGTAPLAFVRDRSSSSPLIFVLSWPADAIDGGYDGVHDVVVHLADRAGNISDRLIDFADTDGDGQLDAGLVVDATPPAPPAVNVEGAVVFERAPWGRLDEATPELHRVVAAAGSVDAHAYVLITRDPELRLEVGRVVADSTGAFVAPSTGALAVADTPTLYLRAADAAGNVGEAVAVRDVRWHVTTLGKRVGSALENPHRFDEVGQQTTFLSPHGAIEVDGAATASRDGATRTTVGAGTWRLANDVATALSTSTVASSGVIDGTLVTDPLRGTTLLLGGRTTSLSTQIQNLFIPQGRCSSPVNDLRIRDARGRWRLGPVPPPELLQTRAAAFVTPLAQIVAVGQRLVTFTFDGVTWQRSCSSCVASITAVDNEGGIVVDTEISDFEASTLLPTSLVWDAARELLFATLSDGRIAEKEAGAAGWRVRPIGLTGASTAFFDARRQRLVLATGPTVQAFDGTTLQALCTGDCVETMPPARAGAVMAYDERHDRFVVFGGLGDRPCSLSTAAAVISSQQAPPGVPRAPPATVAPTETWTFDGTRWTKHEVSGPRGRAQHAMRWDPVRQRVLLVGGDDCNCIASTLSGLDEANITPGFTNDTWEWDGDSWTLIGDPQSPSTSTFIASSPPPARDHVVVEASALGGALLRIGDSTHLFRDDTWWQRTTLLVGSHAPVMPAIAASPTGEIFAVGGSLSPAGGAFRVASPHVDRFDTDGSVGFACANPPSCALPARRFGAAAWHDGDRFYVHGGVEFAGEISELVVEGRGATDSGDLPGDNSSQRLWSFSPAAGWSERCADGSCGAVPGPRLLHRAVVDGDGRAVVFGGLVSQRATTNETWTFADEAWTLLDADDGPPARAGHVLAWDAGRDAVVVAYGSDLGGQTHQIIFNQGKDRLVDHAIPEALSEVWELSGTTWRPVPHADMEGDGRPSPRSSVSGAGLPEGGVLLYGGTPAPTTTYAEAADLGGTTARSDEAWVWDGGADSAPGHRFAVRAAPVVSKREPVDELKAVTMTWCSSAVRTNDTTTQDVQLLWWGGEDWVVVDEDDVVVDGDGCRSAVLVDEEARRALSATSDGTVVVAVTPTTPNGLAPGRATIVTDAVEVQVAWRRPAAPAP